MREMFETPRRLYLVMELVTGGELFDKIVEKGYYSERDAADILRQIVGATAYLHKRNIGMYKAEIKQLDSLSCRCALLVAYIAIYDVQSYLVHRDLKPENLLLSDKSDTAVVKLADFGLSKVVQENVVLRTACGTPGYVGKI